MTYAADMNIILIIGLLTCTRLEIRFFHGESHEELQTLYSLELNQIRSKMMDAWGSKLFAFHCSNHLFICE